MFDLSISEDYYETIIVNSASNNNYIQYESKGDTIVSIEEYLSMIEPYLVDMINDYKNKGEWIIQLTAKIDFISSILDSNKTRIMYTKSINVELMTGSDTNEVIEDLFKSLLQGYQENLEEKKKGSGFVFDGVNSLYYDLNKTSLDRGGSHIKSERWLEEKQATINPQNKKDDKCFQYPLTAALNYEKINNNRHRISKIKPFIDQYNRNEIDFPSTGIDWKNLSRAINQLLLIFYM